MTELEVLAISRELAPLDPGTFPGVAASSVEAFNRRARLLEHLLHDAFAVLQSGSRIAPELARTIRSSASALRARRARLLNAGGCLEP